MGQGAALAHHNPVSYVLVASGQNSWYGECERASFAGRAFDGDMATMQFYDHFDDSQPQTLAAGAPGMVQRDLIEALEDALSVVGGDATAGIAYLHRETVPRLALGCLRIFNHAGGNGDAAAGWSETQGVTDKVAQHLLDARTVGIDAGKVAGNIGNNGNAVILRR